MAILPVGTPVTAVVNTSQSAISCSEPTATLGGHCVVAVLSTVGGSNLTITPNDPDWILALRASVTTTGLTTAVYIRIKKVFETSNSWTFNLGAAQTRIVLSMHAYSGVDRINPLNLPGNGFTTGATGTAVSLPSQIAREISGMVLRIASQSGAGTTSSFTLSTSHTEEVDFFATNSSLVVGQQVQRIDASTTTVTAAAATTTTASPGGEWIGAGVVLRPALVGGAMTAYFLNQFSGNDAGVVSTFGNASFPAPAPSVSTLTHGWTTGTTAPTAYSAMDFNAERAETTFGSTPLPAGLPDATLGDGFKTPSRITGRFAAGNWTLSFAVISMVAGATLDGAIRMRILRGVAADGSDATEVLAATQLSAVTNLSTTEQVGTATVSLPELNLSNEYLFFQIAWVITGAGSASTHNVKMRQGANTGVTSTAFTSTVPVNLHAKVGAKTSRGPWLRLKTILAKVGAKTSRGPWLRLKTLYAKVGAKTLTQAVAETRKKLNIGRYLAGGRGSIEPRPLLWVSNSLGEEVQQIPTVDRLSVSLNNDRDSTFECTAGLLATDVFDPASDYFKATIDYYNGERWERWPMGLYRGIPANEEAFEHSSRWTVEGASLEHVIAEDQAPGYGYSVPPGTWILAHARSVLQTYFSIPASMIDFPDVYDRQIVGWRLYDVAASDTSMYWLNIINETLAAGGFSRLQTDPTGKFVVKLLTDPPVRPADLVYGKYGDNMVDASQAVSIERDSSEFANIIIVTSSDPVLPPIVAKAVNNNPHSPSSIHNRGKRVQRAIQLPEFVNATAAQMVARNELAKRSGVEENLTFHTAPDPRVLYPGLIAQVDLDRLNADLEVESVVAGRWRYEGAAVNLEPVGMMEHQLTRFADI